MWLIAIWVGMLLAGGALDAEYASGRDYERAHAERMTCTGGLVHCRPCTSSSSTTTTRCARR